MFKIWFAVNITLLVLGILVHMVELGDARKSPTRGLATVGASIVSNVALCLAWMWDWALP